ncbi:glycosyltransferase family protein [Acaryochloris marina]|uniref:Spore protein YkvP/CgeB glycosyl transferase-like domain-containing protein n=1 Tax=Acaryochloris marina (strain MBIC 11017) TaxID=329726 RepID=B0C3A4_ACAM1|nr:glycosyltransferase [Acaryochloris marina]ABW28603.1 conserved hypothetical protein [Acaryochloris marina MBIC11017]
MRLTLFWSFYQGYLESFYESHPQLEERTYQYQVNLLLSDYFGWPPALAKKLECLGYEVQILIVNAEPLQYKWAEENGFHFTKNWQYEIAYEQVRQFQPEILWIGSMFNFYGDYLQTLRQICRKVFAWIACPISPSLNLSGIDCVLTSHINFRDSFRRQGQASERLFPAFEPNILNLLDNVKSDIDCSFIGNLTWAHLKRIQVLKQLSKQTPIRIWGNRPTLLSKGLLKKGYIRTLLEANSLRTNIQSSIWGMEMYRILARSCMTVNVHGEVAGGIAGNIRMFEATGVGTLLITENSPNIRELFDPNKEVVVYDTINDLVDKINYYIQYPRQALKIAKAGQLKTLESHTTSYRSEQLAKIFNLYISK